VQSSKRMTIHHVVAGNELKSLFEHEFERT